MISLKREWHPVWNACSLRRERVEAFDEQRSCVMSKRSVHTLEGTYRSGSSGVMRMRIAGRGWAVVLALAGWSRATSACKRVLSFRIA